MNAATTSVSGLATLKAKLKATRMSGDFDKIAQVIAAGGAEFTARLQLKPGQRVLDVACGTGNLSLPAAQAGAVVTGVDIAPNLLVTARERLGDDFTNLQFNRRSLSMDFSMTPPDAVEFFRTWQGPHPPRVCGAR